MVLCAEDGNRPFKSGNKGPVNIDRLIAIARSVVGYPYLLSIASIANGITVPDIPEDAQRIPYAIPLRSIQNSFTKLSIG